MALLILTQEFFLVIHQVFSLIFWKLSLIWFALPACTFLFSTIIFMVITFIALHHADRDTDTDARRPRPSTFIWTVYVALILVPNIIMTFGFFAHELEEVGIFGLRALKRILCMTPFIFLLLMSSVDANSFERCREQMWYLSFHMTIELFDITEMLGIVLDVKQQNYDITIEFEKVVTLVACFAYLLTPLQMEETKFMGGEPKIRYKMTLVRNLLQMIGVNLLFLIVRLTLAHGNDNSISIGISKNVLGMLYSAWTIFHLCKRNSRKSRDSYEYSPLTN